MSTEKTVVTGSKVPQSHLPFSPGVISGNYLFVSGQASVDDTGAIVTDTFSGECRRSFDNLKRIVEAAGATLDDAVQVRNYVGRQEDLAEFNTIYREYFREPFPARTTLIGCLGDVLKFEVDAVIAL
ncbi:MULTISPECIES: RidA family protein [unclassified Spirosoma]|uniref:RidA family protein n=1 Tax=unclassified Spirosoma TaxID=2621999 RepID=UPI00095A0977|nr:MULTISPECIES: RidA family protein [unclassified Spirosoma]MBN8822354.1 RidA family protein [Spirosoma sp.]OJW72348.1 MAG: reactive intermediate/imine deaminase [Spirosoma sp. 48-14]